MNRLNVLVFHQRKYEFHALLIGRPDEPDNLSIEPFSSDRNHIQSLVYTTPVETIHEDTLSDSSLRDASDDASFSWRKFPNVFFWRKNGARVSCSTILHDIRVKIDLQDNLKSNAKKIQISSGEFSGEDVGGLVVTGSGTLVGVVVAIGKHEALVCAFDGSRPEMKIADKSFVREKHQKIEGRGFFDALESREQKFDLSALKTRIKGVEDYFKENGAIEASQLEDLL